MVELLMSKLSSGPKGMQQIFSYGHINRKVKGNKDQECLVRGKGSTKRCILSDTCEKHHLRKQVAKFYPVNDLARVEWRKVMWPAKI